jgi:hypothetical protein
MQTLQELADTLVEVAYRCGFLSPWCDRARIEAQLKVRVSRILDVNGATPRARDYGAMVLEGGGKVMAGGLYGLDNLSSTKRLRPTSGHN